jgi:hypothetical protein
MSTEREERLRVVMIQMDQIVREIGPKWIKLSHLREESQKIIEELQKNVEKGS